MNLFGCITLSVEVWGVKEIPSPFPCSPVIRECLWKITQKEEKKALSVQNLHSAVKKMEASQTLVTYAQAFDTAIKESIKSANKVKCTLLHKQRKMISFARTPSTIKCLEIFKIKVQTFRNWSKFWQESWKGRVNVCQRCSRMPTKLSTRNDYGKSRKSSRKCFFWRAYTSAIAEKQQWRRYWRKN